jgi:hypothetical protein
MKPIYKKTVLAMAGVLLSAGFAMAQTTTVNFANPTCNTAATCGLAGGTNRLTEVSGDNFFFQEAIVINGKQLNHTIVRSKPDPSTGSVFMQETFTPGGAIQGATNTASTDQLTFKQTMNATGGTVSSLTRMDNLNIINKGTGTGQENMVGTEMNITQSITDTSQGLNTNTVTITPNTSTTALGDFNTSINQAVSDPTTPGFSSTMTFTTGQPAAVDQSF